ncbi:hypothetical protein C0995_000810, partial [Termitomyces sp. Mi166
MNALWQGPVFAHSKRHKFPFSLSDSVKHAKLGGELINKCLPIYEEEVAKVEAEDGS